MGFLGARNRANLLFVLGASLGLVSGGLWANEPDLKPSLQVPDPSAFVFKTCKLALEALSPAKSIFRGEWNQFQASKSSDDITEELETEGARVIWGASKEQELPAVLRIIQEFKKADKPSAEAIQFLSKLAMNERLTPISAISIRDYFLTQIFAAKEDPSRFTPETLIKMFTVITGLMSREQVRNVSAETMVALLSVATLNTFDRRVRLAALNQLDALAATWLLPVDYYENSVTFVARDYFRTELEMAAKKEKDDEISLRLHQVSLSYHFVLTRDEQESFRDEYDDRPLPLKFFFEKPLRIILDPELIDRLAQEVSEALSQSQGNWAPAKEKKYSEYLNHLRFCREFSYRAAEFLMWFPANMEPDRGVKWLMHFANEVPLAQRVVKTMLKRFNGPFSFEASKNLVMKLMELEENLAIRARVEENFDRRQAASRALADLLENDDYLVFRAMHSDIRRIEDMLDAAGAASEAFEELDSDLNKISRDPSTLLDVDEAVVFAKILQSVRFSIQFTILDSPVNLEDDLDDEEDSGPLLNPSDSATDDEFSFIRNPELFSRLRGVEEGEDVPVLIWLSALHRGLEIVARDGDALHAIYAEAVLHALKKHYKPK